MMFVIAWEILQIEKAVTEITTRNSQLNGNMD